MEPIADAKREYWCFISYRHADNKEPGRQWATWLHQRIETYEIPTDLVGTTNLRGDRIPDRIFPVFRDEDELPADADLASPIYRALDASRFLVVLCSPRARASLYVANEISHFKASGKSERVLAALIAGEPNASWNQAKGSREEDECFPLPLMHPVDGKGVLLTDQRAEPIAADFRLSSGGEGWTSPEALRQQLEAEGLSGAELKSRVEAYQKSSELAFLKIIAGILGVSLGTLTARDKTYQLEKARRRARVFRRVSAALAVLALIAVGGGVFALIQREEARRQRVLADARANEALEQRGLAEKRQREAEERRQEAELAKKAEAEQRRAAEASEDKAIRNLKTAREQQYLSGIRYAKESIKGGRTDNARLALFAAPEEERSLEWDVLLDLCGPSALKFDASKDPGLLYQGDPAVKASLSAAWKRMVPLMEGSGVRVQMSPSKRMGALFDPYSGRQGTRLRVFRVGFSEPVMELLSGNYGGIEGVEFTDDDSLMIVKMDLIRGYQSTVLGELPDKDESGEPVEIMQVIRVPERFSLGPQIKNSELFEFDWSETPEMEFEARAWRSSGFVVLARQLVGNEWKRYLTQSDWSLSNDGALRSEMKTDEECYSQLLPLGRMFLPSKEAQSASRLVGQRNGKELRALSTSFETPDGHILGLVNSINSSSAGEIWDLTESRLIRTVGESVNWPDINSENLFTRDVGGAFNADGTLVLVGPVKPPPGFRLKSDEGEEYDADSALAVFSVADGRLLNYLENTAMFETGRSSDPRFGFSPLSKHVCYSLYDGSEPSNSISVFDARTGADRKELGGYHRYLGWSPDEKNLITVDSATDAMTVQSLVEPQRKVVLQGAVMSGTGPAHEEIPIGQDPLTGRYLVGKYLFGEGGLEPLIDLDVVTATSDLRRWLIRSGPRSIDVVRGDLRQARLDPSKSSKLTTANRLLLDELKRSGVK